MTDCPPRLKVLGGLVLKTSPHKIRTRPAEILVGFLGSQSGAKYSKYVLMDLLWPEKEGDKQAQNLRKAVSDVRTVLEDCGGDPQALCSSATHLWIQPGLMAIDADEFISIAQSALETRDVNALKSAARLYEGPLLNGFDFPHLVVRRAELEERFGQVISLLLVQLLRNGCTDEALIAGRQALINAPLREDIHAGLIRAYASAGMKLEALRQFEEFETLLNDHWGETPSQIVIEALESEPAPTPPKAVPHDFYIERKEDAIVRKALLAGESTILIQGPRQVGKTTLLGRVLQSERERGHRVVVTDFQMMSRSQFATVESFYHSLATGFAMQLGVDLDCREHWQNWLGPNANLERCIERVLDPVSSPVIWALDEADRAFGHEYTDDFFGILRSWHNRHTLDPQSVWQHLRIVISYATEASLFIKDIHQSPFNVGVRVKLNDFTLDEVAELIRRYEMGAIPGFANELWDITHGQPFLTRHLLEQIQRQPEQSRDLNAIVLDPDGPFADHLSRLMRVCEKDPEVLAQAETLLKSGQVTDPKVAGRMVAGGLLVKEGQDYTFRLPIYGATIANFIGNTLS